jgi:uncharacterized protein with ATP-grasp and redox domains
MERKPGCADCILKQTLFCAELSGATDALLDTIKKKASELIENTPPSVPAPILAAEITRFIREQTRASDPYKEIKEKSAQDAEAVFPSVKETVGASADPLRAAITASAVANVIDFGIPGMKITPERIIDEFNTISFEIDDIDRFREDLKAAQTILFLMDNAGEIVFDRLLLTWMRENLTAELICAVRGGPIINDATRVDAKAHGIDKIARIIDTGCRIPGAALSRCSPAFKEVYDAADLVVSKGQGNFEVLEGEPKDIYFILKAKCDPVARYLGVSEGSLIVMKNRPR